MIGARWLAVAALALLCGLGCRNRTPVGTTTRSDVGLAPPASGDPPGAVADPGQDAAEPGGRVQFDVPVVEPAEGVEVKLDGSLIALVRAYQAGGDTAVKALVSSEGFEMRDELLRVGVTVSDEAQVASVRQRVEELGGEVIVGLATQLYAFLPVAAVESLAAEEAVWSMALPQRVASPFPVK
ncbi:MAG: hypothetical protein OXC19_24105 [Bryobacterales bacterium]|nr:hypothetical protein [Bryobacterales bacterium]